MAGYDLKQVVFDPHNTDCRCRSCQPRTTGRGFPAPTEHTDKMRHERDMYLTVRLSAYERSLLTLGGGVRGKFVLMAAAHPDNGAFDLVRVTE